MNIETVNELIQSLESAGELSIREQKFLKLAKAFKQLAAENVALKNVFGPGDAVLNFLTIALRHTTYDQIDLDDVSLAFKMSLPETPATDRIVAGIKADGVALVKSAFEMHIQSASCYQDEIVGMESAMSIACQVESQLREGADK
ncbi:TPA: hypothetical protein OML33_002764 [Klebsiella pneumoniae]|uniref:hypothetical protein n=1 Tax=Klebsiella pneumoniae TaxID=573 RepID=UPI000C79AFD7|nr:hypothetical protein [Klebsiella pneumoniae]MBC4615302.1 hypothetical protein [Klebsiella pneumoniae]MBE9317556.1 hypothetical protein [Klebsiella pneumoniae]MBF8018437.1 hypothetical protein [Klebsiella pneumoniae]MBF8090468.1 hypothetical protein [Klebsiella pneumoniae]MBF8137911.1 hypothetical protein [Klebsiella pneumoniae]